MTWELRGRTVFVTGAARGIGAESARRAAMPAWVHEYNHHRPHTAIGKATPITRLTNVPGQYT